ncbi:MAG: hypothetical protein PHG51_06345 [Candidatus Omnitrophica bacterium]|nr:hypothetical protein [Candidatus Omnitrophota bacterium]
MVKFQLMNGKEVEASQDEIDEFISQKLIPNPDWRYNPSLLSREEWDRYMQGMSSVVELKKVAKYILTYFENLSLTSYLFEKADGNMIISREINLAAIKAIREIYKRLTDPARPEKDIAGDVHEMEDQCMEVGADPL